MLTFLLGCIPGVNTMVSTMPPVVRILLFGNVCRYVLINTLFLIIRVIVNGVLRPQVVNRHLKVSAVIMFLSLLV